LCSIGIPRPPAPPALLEMIWYDSSRSSSSRSCRSLGAKGSLIVPRG
jgi:hypothetical protein